MSAPVFRLVATFSGRVQGVGFRYTTLQVAREFEVTGFVKNLPDGRVHLEIEGDRSAVENFFREVCERMDAYIRKTEKRENIAPRQFSTFQIVK